ncbi:hypothetical protein [Synechococcus sp. BDU 130192]|uniref:hypothetical protein n=1 Tax=Synechococcus sp. BDU 130192 TaxID=2042059 RepID=UPI000C079436|nr:hypothetical protein [Synechococcus sp. BDU 130192]
MSDVAPLNLQDLQADLQTQLEAEYFPTDPIQVRCLFKEGLLLVLVQHQAPAPAELPPLFRLIRDRLQGDPRVQGHQTLIYLRITGANEPYAFHALTQSEVEPVSDGEPPESELDSPEQPEFPEDIDLEATDDPFPSVGNELEEDSFDTAVPEEEPTDSSGDFEGFTTADGGLEEFTESSNRPRKKGPLILGASLLLVLVGVAGYGLSRPCVIGACAPLTTATQLADPARSLFAAGENPSGQAILQAQANLEEAIATLETVPRWSPRYGEVQTQIADYQSLNGSLGDLITGLSQGATAAQMAENPPSSVAQWQEIIEQWQTAIATLDAIPAEDFYYDFAQAKRASYQQNLEAVEQRVQQLQAQESSAPAAASN